MSLFPHFWINICIHNYIIMSKLGKNLYRIFYTKVATIYRLAFIYILNSIYILYFNIYINFKVNSQYCGV